MPVRSAAVGLTTGPFVVEITPRRIIAYAGGLGDTNPRYFDDAAAAGIVAHPAFCTSLEWPAALALRQQLGFGVTKEELLRGVHAAQDSSFYRVIRPGDRLRTVATIVQVRHIKPGAFVLTRFETSDERTQQPVVTSHMSSIYRGVEVEGEDTQIEAAPALPADLDWTELSASVAIPIAREAPHVYTECAQIWNPIHTERRVALAAGLPDIILHGTATWALAASQLIQRCADGEPTRLQRLVGRFTAMVIPGTSVTLRYAGSQGVASMVSFSVCNAEGATAISQGLAIMESAS